MFETTTYIKLIFRKEWKNSSTVPKIHSNFDTSRPFCTFCPLCPPAMYKEPALARVGKLNEGNIHFILFPGREQKQELLFFYIYVRKDTTQKCEDNEVAFSNFPGYVCWVVNMSNKYQSHSRHHQWHRWSSPTQWFGGWSWCSSVLHFYTSTSWLEWYVAYYSTIQKKQPRLNCIYPTNTNFLLYRYRIPVRDNEHFLFCHWLERINGLSQALTITIKWLCGFLLLQIPSH